MSRDLRREKLFTQQDWFAVAIPVLWVSVNGFIFLCWFGCSNSRNIFEIHIYLRLWAGGFCEALKTNTYSCSKGDPGMLNLKSGEVCVCLC